MSGNRSRQMYLTQRARVDVWLRSTRSRIEHHESMEGDAPEVRTPDGWLDVADLLDELEEWLDAPH